MSCFLGNIYELGLRVEYDKTNTKRCYVFSAWWETQKQLGRGSKKWRVGPLEILHVLIQDHRSRVRENCMRFVLRIIKEKVAFYPLLSNTPGIIPALWNSSPLLERRFTTIKMAPSRTLDLTPNAQELVSLGDHRGCRMRPGYIIQIGKGFGME